MFVWQDRTIVQSRPLENQIRELKPGQWTFCRCGGAYGEQRARPREAKPLHVPETLWHMSYSPTSLKGGYMGDYIGNYYRGH